MTIHAVARQAPVHTLQKSTRLFIRIGLLLACVAASQHSAANTKGVYVAGKGATLEQAFGQALEEGGSAKEAFWIVASGAEATRLTRSAAAQNMLRSLHTVRERGGHVYVCRSDLLRAHIKEEELVDGVASVYGYGTHEWAGLLPAKKMEIVLPKDDTQAEAILNTCSGDHQLDAHR